METARYELWTAYGNDRNVSNRNRLVEAYYGECKKIACSVWNKYKKKAIRLALADWVSECLVKLLYVIERFDYENNDNFGGFLYLCLRREFKRWTESKMNTETLRYAETFKNTFGVEYPEDFSEETEQKLRQILGDDYIDSKLSGQQVCKPSRGVLRYARELVA